MSGFHEEDVLGKAYDARLMRRLLGYLRPYWLQVTVALAAIIASSLVQLAQPYLLKIAIDRHIAVGDLEGLNTLGLLFVAVHWLLRRRFVDDDPGSLTAWWFDIAGISTFGLIAVGLLVVGTGQTLTGDGTAWLSVSLPGGLLSLAVCLLFVRDLNTRSETT